MSGNKVGGRKAAATNKALYGEDFYVKVGRVGGKTPTTLKKGFAAVGKAKASEAGKKGGAISRKNQ